MALLSMSRLYLEISRPMHPNSCPAHHQRTLGRRSHDNHDRRHNRRRRARLRTLRRDYMRISRMDCTNARFVQPSSDDGQRSGRVILAGRCSISVVSRSGLRTRALRRSDLIYKMARNRLQDSGDVQDAICRRTISRNCIPAGVRKRQTRNCYLAFRLIHADRRVASRVCRPRRARIRPVRIHATYSVTLVRVRNVRIWDPRSLVSAARKSRARNALIRITRMDGVVVLFVMI